MYRDTHFQGAISTEARLISTEVYVIVWHYIRLKSCDKIIWTILQFQKSVGMTLDVLISLWNWTIVFVTWPHVLLLGRWSVRQDIKTRKGEVMKAVSDILKKKEGGGGTGPFSSNFKALFGQIIRSSTFKTFVKISFSWIFMDNEFPLLCDTLCSVPWSI